MATATPGDPITVAETLTLDGVAEPESDVQVVVLGYQGATNGDIRTVRPSQPVPTEESGTYDYAHGDAPANVNVPTGARIKRVTAVPTEGGAISVNILSKGAIVHPAGWAFDEQIPGLALGTASTSDVVIGGDVAMYYVSWVTA